MQITVAVKDDTLLIAELNSLSETCIKGVRMEKEAGLRIGELLTQKRGDPKKRWGFNEWVAKNCRFSRVMAFYYMKAFANVKLLSVNTSDWTLTELAQGKKYEPPPEPVATEIKVATTEFPPVVVKQPDPEPPKPTKPSRPPCPGVEGTAPGQYLWADWDNRWVLMTAPKQELPQDEKPTPIKSDEDIVGIQTRCWIAEYVMQCGESTVVKILEAIRREEHPDRGGSVDVTVKINEFLRRK